MFFFFFNVSNLDVYFLNFNEKLDISTLIAADDRMTDSLSHSRFSLNLIWWLWRSMWRQGTSSWRLVTSYRTVGWRQMTSFGHWGREREHTILTLEYFSIQFLTQARARSPSTGIVQHMAYQIWNGTARYPLAPRSGLSISMTTASTLPTRKQTWERLCFLMISLGPRQHAKKLQKSGEFRRRTAWVIYS